MTEETVDDTVGQLAKSADPLERPAIRPGYLTAESDARVLLSGMRHTRRIFGAPALAACSEGEIAPGPEIDSLETAKEYALVELLVLNRGKLVTRTMIYDHIYDENDDTFSNVVDVNVAMGNLVEIVSQQSKAHVAKARR